MVVHEQQAGAGVAGHIDVRPSIVVEIAGHHGEAVVAARVGDSRRLTHVGECSVAVIAIEAVLAERQAARSAIDRQVKKVAVRFFSRTWRRAIVEAHVIGYKQVEMSIPVVIQERASGPVASRRTQQSGLARYVGESSVPIVAIEYVLPPISQEDIVETIVVIIADAYAAGPAGLGKSGFDGDVAKRAIAIVMVKTVGDARFRVCEPVPAQHQNIDPSVIVVVEKGASAANRFENVVLGILGAVENRVINSSFSRHFDKMGVVGQAGSLAPRQSGVFVRDDALRQCRGRGGIQRAQQKCPPRLLHSSHPCRSTPHRNSSNEDYHTRREWSVLKRKAAVHFVLLDNTGPPEEAMEGSSLPPF